MFVEHFGLHAVADFLHGINQGFSGLREQVSFYGGVTFSPPVNSVQTDGAVNSIQNVEDSSGNTNLVWADDVHLDGSGFGSDNNSQVLLWS